MDRPGDLRASAGRYRQMARLITDPRTINALIELAAKYEAEAAQMEVENQECPACSTDFR